MTSVRTRVLLFSGAAIAALGASPALAQVVAPAGTTSGTVISNQASVGYTIGGSTTSALSNTVTFLVDKKVNLTVTAVSPPTYVAIGSTDQVTTFTVQNNTNSVQDFQLAAAVTPLTIPLLGTGDFTPTSVRVYADTNKNGVWDAGDLDYIDELAPDATIKVFIVANIPNTAGIHNGIVALTAIAAEGGAANAKGAVLVRTPVLDLDRPNSVDIVFADSAGPLLTSDLDRDGTKIAFSEYSIDNATITLTKTSKIISDPVSGIISPKAIPGAIIEYCITASSAGPGTATGVQINDTIPANTTYVPGSVIYGVAGTLGVCIAGTNTNGTFDGTAVHAPLGSLGTVIPLAASFRVTVN